MLSGVSINHALWSVIQSISVSHTLGHHGVFIALKWQGHCYNAKLWIHHYVLMSCNIHYRSCIF